MKTRVLTPLGALVTGAGLLLTGCSSQSTPAQPPKAATGIEFVIGAHANQPAPDVTQAIGNRIEAAIAAEQPIGIVTVEGTPQVPQQTVVFPLNAQNEGKRKAAATMYAKAVVAAIRQAKPTTAGADLLGALIAAAHASSTASPRIREIVVVDNGLSDTGALNFTRAGATEASGADVAKQLLQKGELSATTFAGMHVEFVGLGAVAAPQPRLAEAQVANISTTYRSIVKAGGGTASVTPVPRTGAPVETPLRVKVVKPQPTSITFGDTQRFGDSSPVAFDAGTATFRNPAAARALLEPLATWLKPSTSHTARIVGTTSSEGNASRESDLRLSKARATAVKTLLVTMGADGSKIEAVGKGYIADPPDRMNGKIDPAKAALNRVVRITTHY